MTAEIIALPQRRWRPGRSVPGFRPEIQALLDKLAGRWEGIPGFAPVPGGFEVDGPLGRSRATFQNVSADTPDGYHCTEIGEVRTDLKDSLQSLTGRQVAAYNRLAALGALIRDPDSGRLVVVSRNAFLEGDDLLSRYGLLMDAALHAHADQVAAALIIDMGDPVPEDKAWDRRQPGDPGPWGVAEFGRLAHLMRGNGFTASADATGIFAETGWPASDEGGPQVARFALSALEPHPLFGDGLLCTLELPLVLAPRRAAALANKLNRLELRTTDGAPFFGAWCARPERAPLAWVTFLPDRIFQPGLVGLMGAWLVVRERWARAQLLAACPSAVP